MTVKEELRKLAGLLFLQYLLFPQPLPASLHRVVFPSHIEPAAPPSPLAWATGGTGKKDKVEEPNNINIYEAQYKYSYVINANPSSCAKRAYQKNTRGARHSLCVGLGSHPGPHR